MSNIRIHSLPSGQEHWALTKDSSCPVCGAMHLNPCRNSVQANDTLPKHSVHVARLDSVGARTYRTDIMPKYNPAAKMLSTEQVKALRGQG